MLRGEHSATGSETNKHGANWFFRRTARGASNSGGCNRIMGTSAIANAPSHFTGDFLADGSLGIEGLGFNTEESFLGFVAISDQAGKQHGGGPWDICKAVRKMSASAGF